VTNNLNGTHLALHTKLSPHTTRALIVPTPNHSSIPFHPCNPHITILPLPFYPYLQPGTGKTVTSASLVYHLAKQNMGQVSESDSEIKCGQHSQMCVITAIQHAHNVLKYQDSKSIPSPLLLPLALSTLPFYFLLPCS
jgi:hypothetical protein